ncbi:MAG: hypothetical protein WCX73_05520, partial [Candidatus Pacearchaeota archaeon]
MSNTINLKIEVDNSNSLNSLKQLKSELILLQDKLSKTKEGSKEFNSISTEIDKTTIDIKDLNKSLGVLDKSFQEVGNEAEGTFKDITKGASLSSKEIEDMSKDATKSLEKTNDKLDKSSKSVKDFGNNAKGTKKGLNVFAGGIKGIGKALKTLGVVTIVVSAFKYLFDMLKKNQKVVDFFAKVMTSIDIIFHKVLQSLKPLSDKLKTAFDDPKQAVLDLWEVIKTNLVNRFKGLVDFYVQAFGVLRDGLIGVGLAVKGIFNAEAREKSKEYFEKATEGAKDMGESLAQAMTGIEDLPSKIKDGYDKVKDVIVESVKSANEYENAMKRLAISEGELNKFTAENKKTIEELKLIRDDETKSSEEKISASEKINALIEEETRRSIELQKEKIRLHELNMKNTETLDEDIIEHANLQAELSSMEAAAATQKRENLMRTNAIRKQSVSDEKADLEELLRLELDSYDKINSKQNDSLSNQIKRENDKNKIIGDSLKEQQSLYEVGSAEYIAIQQQIEEQDKTHNENLITLQTERNELLYGNEMKKLELDQQLADQTYEQRIKNLDALYQLELDNINKEGELLIEKYGKDSEEYEAFLLKKRELDQQYKTEKDVIDEEDETQTLERIMSFNESLALLTSEDFEEKHRLLEEDRVRRMDALDQEYADIVSGENKDLKRHEEYLKKKNELDAKYTDAKLVLDDWEGKSNEEKAAIAADVAGQAADLFEEETIAHKVLATAQALINTYLGATSAYSKFGPILGPIMSGIIIAQGLQSVNKINSVKTTYETGGMLEGPSHKQGGIPIEVEGGEAIINKKSMKNPVLRNIASMINVEGGGKSFSSGGLTNQSKNSSNIKDIINEVNRYYNSKDDNSNQEIVNDNVKYETGGMTIKNGSKLNNIYTINNGSKYKTGGFVNIFKSFKYETGGLTPNLQSINNNIV